MLHLEPLLLSLSRYFSYRLVAVCIGCTPIIHVVGILWHTDLLGPKTLVAECQPLSRTSWRGVWRFPFTGGNRHTAFQLTGWIMWAASGLACIPLLLSNQQHLQALVPMSHADVLSGAAATSSFIGLLFAIKALLVYEASDTSKAGEAAVGLRTQLSFARARRWLMNTPAGQALYRHGPAAAVLLMGLMISVTGVLLLLSLEHMPDIPSRLLYCCLALVCLIIGASSTHGLGGYLAWRAPRSSWMHLYSSTTTSGAATSDESGSVTPTSSASASPATPSSPGAPRSKRGSRKGSAGQGGMGSKGSKDSLDAMWGGQVRSPGGEQAGQDGMLQAADQPGVWTFFQPFAGGSVFVATQAVAWSLFAVTVVMIVALGKALVAGMVHSLRSWVLGAGTLMVLTQVMLGVSVLTWNHQAARFILVASTHQLRTRLSFGGQTSPGTAAGGAGGDAQGPQAGSTTITTITITATEAATTSTTAQVALQRKPATGLIASLKRLIDLHGPMIIMYVPVQTFFTLWALCFAFSPSKLMVLAWLIGLPLGYVASLVGEPQHTGRRQWHSFKSWFSRNIEASLTWWFGSVKLVADWDNGQQPTADAKYIFGFHPHGLYPTGAGYLPLLPAWRRLLPGINPVTLTASVIYYVPAIKDLSLWLGFRQVSKRTFVRTLKECGSVMVCPGGQAELVYAFASHNSTPSVHPYLKGTHHSVHMPTQPSLEAPARLDHSSMAHAQSGDVGGALTTVFSTGQHSKAVGQGSGLPWVNTGNQAQSAITKPTKRRGAGSKGTDRHSSSPTAGMVVQHVNGHHHTAHHHQQQQPVANGTALAAAEPGQSPDSDGVDAAQHGSKHSDNSSNQDHHNSRHSDKPVGELVVYSGHKGFIKLAIEQQAALIPVLAVGEVLQLRNLIHMPATQRWTYKRLGFPVPWFMVGRWGLSPLPLRTELVYVIGKPIQPPPLRDGRVCPADVELLHQQFYSTLADMYTRHAHLHPQFKDTPLTLLSGHAKEL